MKPMHVTLIRPDMGHPADRLGVDESRMEPLQLGVLAALTPPDVEVALVDDRVEPIPYRRPTDLVAITVETFTARRAYQIAAEYRRRGVKVVMGGFHATLAPEEVAEHADAVYTGDAEGGWAEVLADAAAGRLRRRYDCASRGRAAAGCCRAASSSAARDYLPLTLVQFGRGCPHGCHFCAIGAFFGQRAHTRPVAEVVAELEAARARTVFFVDDNIVADRSAAKELFRALIPLKLRWVSQAAIDMTEDRELMDLMARSGCLGHVIGFESLDPANAARHGQAGQPGGRAPRLPAGRRGAARPRAADLGRLHDRSRRGHRRLDPRHGGLRPGAEVRLRRVQHPHPVPGDAALPPAGGGGAAALRRALVAPPRLPLQPRRLRAGPHDAAGADRGLLGGAGPLQLAWAPGCAASWSRAPTCARPLRMAIYWGYNGLFRREVAAQAGHGARASGRRAGWAGL